MDFAAFPACADTRLAGPLLAISDLVALDLPALITKTSYRPGMSHLFAFRTRQSPLTDLHLRE